METHSMQSTYRSLASGEQVVKRMVEIAVRDIVGGICRIFKTFAIDVVQGSLGEDKKDFMFSFYDTFDFSYKELQKGDCDNYRIVYILTDPEKKVFKSFGDCIKERLQKRFPERNWDEILIETKAKLIGGVYHFETQVGSIGVLSTLISFDNNNEPIGFSNSWG